MASMNDLLTVSLILILLFGAVSLYMYTRIQQCEQKLNLVESVLLDIKMSAELREYPDIPQPSSSVQKAVVVESVPAPFEEEAPTGLESDDIQELIPETVQIAVPQEPVHQEIKPSSNGTKVSVNYESMTLAELKNLAKQRGITGFSSMKRSQILEALHASDNKSSLPVDGGILSALAEVSSSLTEGDVSVLA